MTNRLHIKYAKYLKSKKDVERYEYRKTRQKWINGFNGMTHIYKCDFTIYYKNGKIENVQVVPLNKQMPLTKYLYAQNNLENWRFITAEELDEISKHQ